MSFLDSLSTVASVAAAVERLTELIKPSYLKIKNKIMKKDFTECTKAEKIVCTMLLGVLICILYKIGIDIPGANEPVIVQQLLAGLISSFGSNFLHILLSILTGIKDTTESRAIRGNQNITSRSR